ncbi:MAG: ABC transporter substrate-binding protein [Prevotellaceae bacterium]|jgi:iron complex transport system substrate-binding protein|nr:ABC transporter substrate-binding protein [Prevotellaceae bacterium]
MSFIKIFFIPCIAGLLVACNGGQKSDSNMPEADSTLLVSYAKGFSVDYFDNYKRVTVINHWEQTERQTRYYLVNDTAVATPADGRKISVPLRSVGITSCTHIEPFALLGEIGRITGVCLPHLIYNDRINLSYEERQIVNLGDPYNLNIEQIIRLYPDGLMLSSDAGPAEQEKRLMAAGTVLLYNNEWREPSVLGRAEWIKFIGVFFGKEALAGALFSQMEARYNAAKAIAQACDSLPTVFCGSNFKGTWYMPGGNGYMGQFFADAGGNYIYASNPSSESLPLSFETALHDCARADVWLNAPVASLSELYQLDSRHQLFKAAQEGNVFALLRRTKKNGANDFWESAIAHPDIVLKDFIWALHSDLLPDYQPVYILRLAN